MFSQREVLETEQFLSRPELTIRSLQTQNMISRILFCLAFVVLCRTQNTGVVVNTWNFTQAADAAWNTYMNGGNAVDAIEAGCTKCEQDQCDGTVGYGGSPSESGEVTLDALIIDGRTMDAGAVGCLKRIKSAISVARNVMEHTEHTFLVGEDATQFAINMGFKEESLSTNTSDQIYENWFSANCQPNYWESNVVPDPETSCGPYSPSEESSHKEREFRVLNQINREKPTKLNHDTIGMVAIDPNGDISAGTSTNGASHKISGRVGDSPIIGAGAYLDPSIGGAAATGDGDIMMRFLPSHQAVLNMGNGMTPTEAAEDAIRRILKYFPTFQGGVVALNIQGEHGAAGCNWGAYPFSYSLRNSTLERAVIVTVPLIANE